MSTWGDNYLSKYDYHFPKELIAQSPASPRDTARLLVYDRKTKRTRFDTFLNLPKYLPPRSVLVFNQTKVIPARIEVKKETGGKAVLLYISHGQKLVTVLSDRRLEIGTTLKLSPRLAFRVQSQQGKYCFLAPSFPLSSLIAILVRCGRTPLPPYITHAPLSERRLRKEYQTVFAKTLGSVAAPTASLHFTKRLLKKLRNAGHDVRFITLHVGLGTFAPLTEENLKTGTLHEEHFSIDSATARSLTRAKREVRPIIAVGTTVVRALESSVQPRMEDEGWPQRKVSRKLRGHGAPPSGASAAESQAVSRTPGGTTASFRADIPSGRRIWISECGVSTNLFIRPGYRFKFVDGLITNFHVPRSSLLMLVSAFAGRQTTMRLYQTAIAENFRLFSFGDGVLIL